MKSKIILIVLILFSIFTAGCENEKKIQIQGQQVTNTQSKTVDSQSKDNSQPKNNNTGNNTQPSIKVLSQVDALKLADSYVGKLGKNYYMEYHSSTKIGNREFYLFRIYEVVIDDPQSGASHQATTAWVYVDKNNGEIFEYGIMVDSLTLDFLLGATGKIQSIVYTKYYNDRFGFSIEYPSAFIIKVVPVNNDGRVFSSTNDNVELTVSGINNVLNDTAKDEYNNLLKNNNFSYIHQEDNWIVESWTDNFNNIYYEKCVVGSGSIDTFIIKYPSKLKGVYDEIIPHMLASFKTPAVDSGSEY